MDEDTVADEFDVDDPDADLEGLEGPKKFSGKKIVLFVAVPLLLLGIGAGVMFSGVLDSSHDEKTAGGEHGSAAPLPPIKTVFYELPEMLVNLNSSGRRPSFLKIKVSLEVKNEAEVKRLQSLQPRIVDHFQVYLRELRIDDLRGSAGIYRLREELLARVNSAVQPIKVTNVLFREVLVQ